MRRASPEPAGLPRPDGLYPVSLGELTRISGARIQSADDAAVAVTGLTLSSSRVHPGDLFAGVPGQHGHGARFASAALAAGAVAVLTDPAGRELLPVGVATLVADDVRGLLGPLSCVVYGNPSAAMNLLGVTGTSGKTTTTFLMRSGLAAAGRVPGVIGTVATLVGDEEIKTGFTTPEAPDLQALLAVMRERGVTDVAMEVSSHALAFGRVDGIGFAVAGFTNLSEDHLDFHADMDDYFAAKAALFDEGRTRRAVIVVDDEWGRRLAAQTRDAVTVSASATVPATWRADDVAVRADGSTEFRAVGPGVDIATGCAIPGRYNVANALLALAVLHEDGVAVEVAARTIAAATVPGRMERIEAGQPFLAVVDYSHKPAAVEGALRALRPLTGGRLIVVLGCGGDRDRGKRPHMGEIAARDADVLIVTDDNPRSEDPADIRRAMLVGAATVPADRRAVVEEVGDRRAAVVRAVELAGAGDTVLVAGKGHEPGQEIAGVIHPFDDRDVLRAALAAAR